MDDNDLLAAVKQDFAGVRMHTGADAILAEGGSRRRRQHRRLAYGAGATGLAAAAVISTVALTPGSPGPSHVQLTAWTVQKQPDGTVDVTIRDVLNLAGLQRKLNAEGVPAVVYSDVRNPPDCVNAEASSHMGTVVAPGSQTDVAFFVIHPSAIPSGSELLLDVFRGDIPPGPGKQMAAFGAKTAPGAATKHKLAVSARMDIVYAKSNCK